MFLLKLPLSVGDPGPRVMRGSLGPHESESETTSRSVHPFSQGHGWAEQTDTLRPRHAVCSNSPHLALFAVRRCGSAMLRVSETVRCRAARTTTSKAWVSLRSRRSPITPPSSTTVRRPRPTSRSTSRPSTCSTPADSTCKLSRYLTTNKSVLCWTSSSLDSQHDATRICCWARAPPTGYRSISAAGTRAEQQTSCTPLLLSINGTDSRTDGQPTVPKALLRIMCG